MMIYYTDNKFNSFTQNPYRNNLTYDNSWSLIQLLDNAEFTSYTGNNGNGIFRLILTKQLPQWKYCVMDFIEYEKFHNKNIIVAVDSEDLEAAQKAYVGHCCMDRFIRNYEGDILVHTTTPIAFKEIIKLGYLKSWNALKMHDDNIKPIGSQLGDPIDYSDYIMFNNGGYCSELVVASKEKGYIDMDIHAKYTPGGRFYFDAKKIATDGLLTRDGAHLKVRDSLEIKKYLLWTATSEIVGLPDETTPFEFGTKSDEMFECKFGMKL